MKKRSLIRHDGFYNLHGGRFYSIFLERLTGKRLRLLSMSGRKYGGGNGKVRTTTHYEGRDERAAHRLRERLVHSRLKSGYTPETADHAYRVWNHLYQAGARHDELYRELHGISVSPELRTHEMVAQRGALVVPTLRGRTLRRADRRRGYSVPNGRSWLSFVGGTLRLVSQESSLQQWSASFGREHIAALAPFAPFVLEGSHGGIEPAHRDHPYDVPEFLPEDLLKIRGEHVGDLPYSERRVLLEELVKALDEIGQIAMLVPPYVRDQLAQEAELIYRLGAITPKARALPLLRKIGATQAEEDGRVMVMPRVASLPTSAS